MKLNINKACDLSSISVLPPHARRNSVGPSGAESSVFGRIQTSHFRSQQSQQSLSQGVSSQPAIFSQLSQNSPDDIATSEQRFGSQERENSVRRSSCLPLTNYAKEESQTQLLRTSTNFVRKHEFKCQISEELEHRIGVMETSLNKFGMILDSVQSDIIQVKRGMKEILSEMESLRQKLAVRDEALQLLSSGQEEMKTTLQGVSKSMSDELKQIVPQENIKEISSVISALPLKIATHIEKLRDDLRQGFMEEMKAVACSLTVSFQKFTAPSTQPKGMNDRIDMLDMQFLNLETHASEQTVSSPKVETGGWRSARHKQAKKMNTTDSNKRHNKDSLAVKHEMKQKAMVEFDEDSDGGFSCLLDEKESGSGDYTMDDTNEEIKRMLQKARRRKRKHRNTVFID